MLEVIQLEALQRIHAHRVVPEVLIDPLQNRVRIAVIGGERLAVVGRIREAAVGQPCLGILEEIANQVKCVVRTLAPVIRSEGDLLVVEADPRACNQMRMHENEPSVGVALRGTRLPCHVARNAPVSDATAGTAGHYATHHVN